MRVLGGVVGWSQHAYHCRRVHVLVVGHKVALDLGRSLALLAPCTENGAGSNGACERRADTIRHDSKHPHTLSRDAGSKHALLSQD